MRTVASLAGFAPRVVHRADSLELVEDHDRRRPRRRAAPRTPPPARGVRLLPLPDPGRRAAGLRRRPPRAATAWPPLALVLSPLPRPRACSPWTNGGTAARARELSRHRSSLERCDPMLHVSLPVLFVSDLVVLPGMVVPIELDESSQAAIDAARASSDGRLLVAPRLEDRYASYGVIAVRRAGRPVQRRQPRRGAQGRAARPDRQRRHRPRRGAVGRGRAGRRARHRPRPRARRGVQAARRRRPPAPRGLAGHRLRAPDDRPGRASPTRPATRRTSPTTASASCSRRPTSSSGSRPLDRVDPRAPRRAVEITDKIGEDVREGMEKSQREFLLRQQLAAIRKELGEGEPEGADDYRARVEAADVPDAVREALLREVDKLERSSDQSPETALDPHLARHRARAAVERHAPRTSTDVAAARAVLDADHHGLDEVKERIVEYLAVRARRAERGLQVVGGRGSGAVIAARRPARRRQDLAGRVASRGPWAASSSASPSAASATRPRSAATGGRTSARCPAASSGRSRRPAR